MLHDRKGTASKGSSRFNLTVEADINEDDYPEEDSEESDGEEDDCESSKQDDE